MSSSQKNRGAERWTETNFCESRGFDLQDKIVHSQQRHDRNLRITEIIPESSTRYLFYLTDSRSSGVGISYQRISMPVRDKYLEPCAGENMTVGRKIDVGDVLSRSTGILAGRPVIMLPQVIAV